MAFANGDGARRCGHCGTPEARWVQSGYCCDADAAERRQARVDAAAKMLVDLGYTVTPPTTDH